MEKLDMNAIKNADEDFISLPPWWNVVGKKQVQYKKHGKELVAEIVLFSSADGKEVALFADQLRQEGGKLFVSERHYKAQLGRAAKWAASQAAAPQ